jgi:hypothetical protein
VTLPTASFSLPLALSGPYVLVKTLDHLATGESASAGKCGAGLTDRFKPADQRGTRLAARGVAAPDGPVGTPVTAGQPTTSP